MCVCVCLCVCVYVCVCPSRASLPHLPFSCRRRRSSRVNPIYVYVYIHVYLCVCVCVLADFSTAPLLVGGRGQDGVGCARQGTRCTAGPTC